MVKCISDNLANGQQLAFWIETESDKLAPVNTQFLNEKRKLHQFYLSLLKNVQN